MSSSAVQSSIERRCKKDLAAEHPGISGHDSSRSTAHSPRSGKLVPSYFYSLARTAGRMIIISPYIAREGCKRSYFY